LAIAVLEALSYGLPVVASDIAANLEIGLDPSSYFPVGDVPRLAERLATSSRARETQQVRLARRHWVETHYNWDLVAERTLEIYKQVVRQA
jgi:glycosyltransferase involved in cell wall biosynthesis